MRSDAFPPPALFDEQTAAERDLRGLLCPLAFALPPADDGHKRSCRQRNVEARQRAFADAVFGNRRTADVRFAVNDRILQYVKDQRVAVADGDADEGTHGHALLQI